MSRFTSQTYEAPASDPCFACGGGYRHEAGCPLSKIAGSVQVGSKFIVRSALGDYWIGDTADGPYTAFYATPGEALEATHCVKCAFCGQPAAYEPCEHCQRFNEEND